MIIVGYALTVWLKVLSIENSINGLKDHIDSHWQNDVTFNRDWAEQDKLDEQTQQKLFADIMKSQTEIREDLSTMIAKQEEVREEVHVNYTRFEELEILHTGLRDLITTSLDDLNYRLGVHAGEHRAEGATR